MLQNIIFKTPAPSAPQNVARIFKNESVVTLSWDAPRELNGELSRYIVKYGPHEERVSGGEQTATLRVNGSTNYSMSVQACSGGELEVACGRFSDSLYVMTDIGVPMEVAGIVMSPKSHTTMLLSWSPPAIPNGPISYYVVRYRPTGSSMVWEKIMSMTTSAEVTIDCGIVDGEAQFDFQIYAVNEVDGVPLMGAMAEAVDFGMCKISRTPILTIVLSIVLPSLFAVLCFILITWLKQSDVLKPAPNPYFIEAVLNRSDDKFQMSGRLLNKQMENEKFDPLRKADSATNLLLPPYDRLSSKESTSTSSSTDQGIHDMDGFTDEMRYVSDKTTSASGSRNESVSDEEKPLQGAKHAMRLAANYEDDDGVFSGANRGCDGSVTYSRIAEADGGAEVADSSTPMLGKESEPQYISDGSEVYAQLSQVPAANATPPEAVRGLADQRSEDAFGSQSTVSYHRLGMSGLSPITSVETLPSEDPLTYSRLSQGSETDIEYSQLAAASSNPSIELARTEARSGREAQPRAQAEEGKGVAMSLPSVSASSRINPQQEFIVATALAPGNHPHPVSSTQHDNAGYVTSPPSCKMDSPPNPPSPPVLQKQDGKEAPQNLAESKSQSGSDSSLTDGEGYSTLGLAEPSSSSNPRSKALPVEPVAMKSPLNTPDPNSGYVPNDTAPPAHLVSRQQPARESMPATTGYVTQSDLQSISPPPTRGESTDNSSSSSGKPHLMPPKPAPAVGQNGYVASDSLPMMSMPPTAAKQAAANQNTTNPYIPHEQVAGMGMASSNPPRTPPTPTNNNQPPLKSKDSHIADPYVSNGSSAVKRPGDFAVC